MRPGASHLASLSLLSTSAQYMGAVSVSYCCCNKGPQTWWLKATETSSHSSGDQKPKMSLFGLRVSVGLHSLLEVLGENLLPFPAARGQLYPWARVPFLHLHGQRWPVKALSHCVTLTLPSSSSSFTYKDTVITVAPPQ